MSCFSIFRAKGDRAGVAPKPSKPAHRRGGSDSTLVGADSKRTNKKSENKKRGAAQLPSPKFDTVLDKAKAIFALAHVAPVRAPVILDRKKADQKKTKRAQKTMPKPKHVEVRVEREVSTMPCVSLPSSHVPRSLVDSPASIFTVSPSLPIFA
ncbi:hypothetical protein HMN09_00580200 [Mycena chlorophos]|uniref:Uncharacterized protein n=1 Tax=Mycena chlorophos TaxID=658473 RepID=A0A8H6WA41_MYCCL|nr:hypothetical protein HMN09_00580200 [Mycena chlorophos]